LREGGVAAASAQGITAISSVERPPCPCLQAEPSGSPVAMKEGFVFSMSWGRADESAYGDVGAAPNRVDDGRGFQRKLGSRCRFRSPQIPVDGVQTGDM